MGSLMRPEARLEDRWESSAEPVVLTGIQALVRLPLLRRQLDEGSGWNTAGYISGYRGSPLGGYDRELERQAESRLVEDGRVAPDGARLLKALHARPAGRG